MSAVVNAALAVTEAALEALGLKLDEKRGEYYYSLENVKRVILGDGGASGNCELCEENADRGWIPDEQLRVCEVVPDGLTAVIAVEGLMPNRLA